MNEEIEYGAGQFEITMKPSTGIQAADKAFLYKLGVKVRLPLWLGCMNE